METNNPNSLLANLWKSIHSVRPDYTVKDIMRTRPYLYFTALGNMQEDGNFNQDFLDSGQLNRLFSFVEEEMDLRPTEITEMNRIIDHTIVVGLMNDDYTWRRTTTKTQIALWVEMLTERVGIVHKWKWAEERWDIKNLKQARSSTINRYGTLQGELKVLACFEIK